SSGVRWNETYRDPKSDRRQMFDAQLAERPGGILRLLASLPRQYPTGTHFTYSTGESHLQSELLHAATRIPVSDYLSERIWARMGME
ncbi:serine hydrolase, partial [Escherichia coli]|nr:serine hydrolase [Escherichia coli]